MIRLVTFDALHTLIMPRKPIYVQYSALTSLQAERPSYRAGATSWWSEVISRTALGAGADPHSVKIHLGTIAPCLIKRFSSGEGYTLFDDTLETLRRLGAIGVRTGVITNSDARMASVLKDLGISGYLSPILISEEERVEKPSISIFLAACVRGGANPTETLHVGDDLREDYLGADNAGFHALLLRRAGWDGEREQKGPEVDLRSRPLKSVSVVKDLHSVYAWVEKRNTTYEE
ncbi:HAD hydrolase subfamily IA REG-2-like protein [Russula earlei]|uniref:HAD hydrolase subfamily IA REG-2-like protein n=1 Tax=Russula earlei TaxID=71964 RepID=A0ACC0U1X7_9AGAM|nr:HAD hydrolase subfamily IA REG-2-like protein [Russula earlei]